MASIKLVDVSKTHRTGQVAVHGVHLEIDNGELVVLLGPSGCGKTTLLRVVAGLDQPTSGRVLIGERDVTSVPPQDRDVAMVFQNYALYPHKTVGENIGFGLRIHGKPGVAIVERVQRVSQTLGLDRLLDRMPSQLSGGERQRVALGRAIAREPAAFLLDEPLSNLDASLRRQARSELARLHRQLGATMLYVTHDQEEAMTLGDRIAVMRDGQIQQVGRPLDVYRRPVNTFVAGFVGSPAMNLVPAMLRSRDAKLVVEFSGVALELDPEHRPAQSIDNAVILGIRPHDIQLGQESQTDVVAQVELVEALGSELLVYLSLPEPTGDLRLIMVAPASAQVAAGSRVGVRFTRNRLHLFDAAGGARLN